MPNATPTTEGKRRVLDRILAAWERCPNTPLGVLIAEACAVRDAEPPEVCSDEGLVLQIEERAEKGMPGTIEVVRPLWHFPPSTSEPIDYEKLAAEKCTVAEDMAARIAAARARA